MDGDEQQIEEQKNADSAVRAPGADRRHSDVGADLPVRPTDARVPVMEVLEARKAVGSAAVELQSAVAELVQLSLIDEVPFDEALLLPEPEQRKRYTAAQANNNIMRQQACLYMLARQCPAQDIAAILKMNLRTVAALAAQHGRVLAGFTEAYAQELLASAGADIALAETKRSEASYKDLHIGAGIKLTHAGALKAASGGELGAETIEIEAEDPKVLAARAFLESKRTPNNQGTKV